KTAFADVSVCDIDGIELGAITPNSNYAKLEVSNATSGYTITASSTINGATVTLLSGSTINESASNSISRVFQQSGATGTVSEHTVICTYNGQSRSVNVKITKVDSYDENGTQTLSLNESEE
ncbi:MAG: hypothetical protein ACI4WH_07765, partial [Oscillospiraceae bacterium]